MLCYMVDKKYVNSNIKLCDKDYYKTLSSHAEFQGNLDDNKQVIKSVCYIRTTRSNEILLNVFRRIYYSIGVVNSNDYFMFDEMGLLFCKDVFFEVFNITANDPIRDSLRTGLHIFPVGAFVFDNYPHVCYNIIVPDEISKGHPTYLKGGHVFSSMWGQSISDPIVNAMLPSFVLVKGENT